MPEVDQAILNRLCQLRADVDMIRLRSLVEMLVQQMQSNTLSEEMMQRYMDYVLHPPKSSHRKEAKEAQSQVQQIKSLVKSGYSKTIIAKKMGISRATLYRWIKEEK